MTTPLENAETFLREVDEILALPPVASASKRIGKFKELAQCLRELTHMQRGFEDEQKLLISLVAPLLEVISRHSPNIHRAIREEPGFREARANLVAYINKGKAVTGKPDV